MSSPIINILSRVIRKCSKILYRDYCELMNLQTSVKNAESFASKSAGTALKILLEDIAKSYPDDTIMLDNVNLLQKGTSDYRFILNPLEAPLNLKRANPNFAISVSLEKFYNGSYETIASIISLPALGTTYFAEKGKGAWEEKLNQSLISASRIRIAPKTLNNASIVMVTGIGQGKKYSEELFSKLNSMIFDLRIYGSELVSGVFFASGKADAIICLSPGFANISALKLIISEAGGMVVAESKEKNILIYGNGSAVKSLKQLIS